MEANKKVKYLVVDTTGFIKNLQFQEISENVITTPSVTKEITSKRQLRRLVVMPYELILKEPFSESIKHVTEFSKKTGDYASLSATDIQVIALTYQLEKEHVGISHLRTEPIKRVINPGNLPCQDFKEVAGFYVPKLKEETDTSPEKQPESIELNLKDLTVQNDRTEENDAPTADEDVIANDDKDYSSINYNKTEINDNDSDDIDDSGSVSDDDEDGWITPGNIAEMKSKIISAVDDEVYPVVGCITTDFAMQNVLKQMGLNVIALDGRVIKELRTFILRCYACFKTTGIMSKVFCPGCGNKTLKKVAVSINPDGTQKIHINFRKPLTARGKRFSLPTPKGGKHSNNPILCEDQPMPEQRVSRLTRKINNPLDDDYITGFSPFVTRDVCSRSAMLGLRPNSQVKQWMRKNPNESTKPGGRKRK